MKYKKIYILSENNEDQTSEDMQINNTENSVESEDLVEDLKQSLASCEDKLKRSLADFINLERKTKNDIENGVNYKLDNFLLKFLTIYDDLVRAKEILKRENIDVHGLDSILKNIDSLLSEYGVTPINALGEIFDPNFGLFVFKDQNRLSVFFQ